MENKFALVLYSFRLEPTSKMMAFLIGSGWAVPSHEQTHRCASGHAGDGQQRHAIVAPIIHTCPRTSWRPRIDLAYRSRRRRMRRLHQRPCAEIDAAVIAKTKSSSTTDLL